MSPRFTVNWPALASSILEDSGPVFTNRRCGAISPVRSVPDPPASTAPRAREGVKTHARFDATGEAGDADTNDLLIAFSRAVDKQLWFLEAHVSHGE